MKTKFTLLATAAALSLATAAQADTITANCSSVLTWNTPVSVSVNGGSSFSSAYATQIRWTKTASTGTLGNAIATSFNTYCIQLSEDVYVPSTNNNYTVTQNIAAAPLPGSGMGAAAADHLQALFGLQGATAIATNDQTISAAFQLAIWEIVGDSDLNLATGLFRAAASSNIMSLAQSYLNSIANIATGTYNDPHLVALTSPVPGLNGSIQDQITVLPGLPSDGLLVPLPASSIGGLGLLAFAGFRRMRQA
jgi:hypothetical protein